MNKMVIAGHKVKYEYEDWEHEITHDDSDYDHIQELLLDGYIKGEIVTFDHETETVKYGCWRKIN